jgi:hypothetical protein
MPPTQSPLKHTHKLNNYAIIWHSKSLCGGGHLLDLDLRHGGAGAAEVGDLGLWVLGVVVADGGLDGVFGKHRAVNWSKN